MSLNGSGKGGRGGGAGQLSSQSTQLHAGDFAYKQPTSKFIILLLVNQQLIDTYVQRFVTGRDLGVPRHEFPDRRLAGHVGDLEGHEGVTAVTHVAEPSLRVAPRRAVLAAHEVQRQFAGARHRHAAAGLVSPVQVRRREVHLDAVHVRYICKGNTNKSIHV